MAAPMDLNVPFCEGELLSQKLRMASKLGYEVIAINNEMPKLLTHPDKKKAPVKILSPDDIKINPDVLKGKSESGKKTVQLLSRITTRLQDTAQAHILNTDKVQMYDLIAVQPTSEKTLRQACVDLNIDIISLDVTEPLNYKIRRQTVNAAVQRGIHFELTYSPAIRDNTMRRYLISVAESLVFAGKGKNMILTSGCEKPIEIRGPHDVANLGNLLFLTEGQAKNAVTTNCRALLCRSKARKAVQSVLHIEKTDSLSTSDTWLLDKCHVGINSITNDDDKNSVENRTCNQTVKQKQDQTVDEPVKKKQKLKHKKPNTSPNKTDK